jgi:hypothetical protein
METSFSVDETLSDSITFLLFEIKLSLTTTIVVVVVVIVDVVVVVVVDVVVVVVVVVVDDDALMVAVEFDVEFAIAERTMDSFVELVVLRVVGTPGHNFIKLFSSVLTNVRNMLESIVP